MHAASIAVTQQTRSIPDSWTGALTVDETRDLIQRSKIGDRAAFASLYRAYVSLVHHYVAARVPNAKVEDFVAEVFVKALKNINSFEFRGIEFSAWLLRIARNLIVDNSKKASTVREVLHDVAPESHSEVETDTQALANLDAQVLRKALERITPDHKFVLEKRFILGMRCPDIAALMGRSEGAVRVLQFRALAALKRELELSAPHLVSG